MLEGNQILQYYSGGRPFGFYRQTPYPFTDDLTALLASPDFASTGLFFEPLTRNFICEPRVVWKDLTAAQVASSLGPWRNAPLRALGKIGYSQYSSAPDLVWNMTTSANVGANAPFCVHLKLGPCPYNAASRTPDNCYRTVQWPYPYVSGVAFKLKLRYGVPPILEANTGSGFVELGTIYSAEDLSTFDNSSVTLTVLHLDGAFIFWLGKAGDYNREGFIYRTDQGQAAGPLRVEGKNGACVVGWGDLRFKANASYTSHWLKGPTIRNTPRLDVNGKKAAGQTLSATYGISSTIEGFPCFNYTANLAGANPISGTDLAVDTPCLKSVSGLFPPVYDPIVAGSWLAVGGVRQIEESQGFDVKALLEDQNLRVRVNNRDGAWAALGGAQAVRLYLGYGSTYHLRGYYYANTDRPEWVADGGDAWFTFDGKSMLYPLADQPVQNDVYLGNWCAHAAMRFFLEQGGIIPPFLSRVMDGGLIPDAAINSYITPCPYGPQDPATGCSYNAAHPLLPPGQSWTQRTLILSALADIQRMATLRLGQKDLADDGVTETPYCFAAQPFDFNAAYVVKKVFTRMATGTNGENLDEILAPLIRTRHTENMRNQLTLVGMDPDTGQFLVLHDLNVESIENRLSPRHLAFPKSILHAWAGYTNLAVMQDRRDKFFSRLTLPEETVLFNCWGQPHLRRRDVFVPIEHRTVGNSSEYYISQIVHTWEAPAKLTASILGVWTAQENGTNRYPGVWNPQSPYLYF